MNQPILVTDIESRQWGICPKKILRLYADSGTESIDSFLAQRTELSQNEMACLFFLRKTYAGSMKTISDYAGVLCRFLNSVKGHANGPDFYQVNPSQVESYVDGRLAKGTSLATALKYASVIASFYDLLFDMGKINSQMKPIFMRNLTLLRKRIQKQHKGKLTGHVTRSLSMEQIDSLLNTMKTEASIRDFCLVEFFYFVGARSAEVERLTWGDFYFQGKTEGWQVHILGKGGKERRVYVPFHLMDSLMALRRVVFGVAPYVSAPGLQEYPVFCRMKRNGEPERHIPLKYAGIYRVIRKWGERVFDQQGRALSPHDLRHTNASHMKQLGCSFDDIQISLGHSSPMTTRRYVHVDELKSAAGRVFEK